MPSPDTLIFLVVFFPLFMIAVMAHEFAHGYVAYLQGDPTAKYAGRLTLNPVDHLDPVGTAVFVFTVLFSPFVFGWAKPVPVNPLLFKEYRNGIIRVSLAGVAANLGLIIIALVVLKALTLAGVVNPQEVFWVMTGMPPKVPGLSYYLAWLLHMFMTLNLVLFVFNLIPVPPLDGSKVLMMLLPREQAMAFERIEPYGMFILIFLLMTGIIGLIFDPVMHLLNKGILTIL